MTLRRIVPWVLAGALGALTLWAGLRAGAGAKRALDVAQILEKSAAARGGSDAWARVQAMVWSGHLERAERSPGPQFVFEQKRPNLTRFEVSVGGQTSARIFDGQRGWKLRSTASGRPELEPYSDAEQRAAADALVIDGPLLGARAKGVEVSLEGLDEVEGRAAYRLSAKLPSGTVERVWIDAESFLELKYDRPARDATGQPTRMAVYLRDYQSFQGLQIPFTIETRAAGDSRAAERLVIERIAINPNLPDGRFARPGLRTSRRGITVDTRLPPPGTRAPSARSAPARAPSTAVTAAARGAP